MSLGSVDSNHVSVQVDQVPEVKLSGFQIGKISKIALNVLTGMAVAAVAAVFVASVMTGTLPLGAMIASSVSLAVLGIAKLTPHLLPYLPKQVQRVINVIRVTVVDVFAVIAMACLYPILQTRFDPKRIEQITENQTPILLVHGYLHNSSGWAYHKYHYKKAGYDNIFTVNLGHPLQSIDAYVEKLEKKIASIKEITGSDKIRLVGHSMGGIVASKYALAHQEEIEDLVTLGSPLQGTHMGKIGIGQCTNEMTYGSEYTKTVSEELVESNIRRYHLGSKADIVILPAASSIINDDGSRSKYYKNLGHLSFLLSDRVIRDVIRHFKTVDQLVSLVV